MRAAALPAILTLCLAASTDGREWKDATGRIVQAEMLGLEQGRIVVQLPDKRRAAFPLDKASPPDKAWVSDWAKDKSPEQRLPAPVWPESVKQPEVNVKTLAKDQRGWIFKSPHYDFTCDAEVSTSVMNDFATVAEGCSLLMETLPIHFPRSEGRTFYARIFQNRDGYARAGGPPGSSGVFITADIAGGGVLLVPFESLGIEQFGGRNTKGYDYKATVLIHEMVHQATAELLPLMPKWVSEGLAEYGANMTYRSGVFYLGERERLQSLHRRLDGYELITRNGMAKSPTAAAGLPKSWVMKPSEVMGLSDEDWSTAISGRAAQVKLHRMYLSSMFLMYYFMHLADHGEARRIRVFFDNVAEASRFIRSRGNEGTLPAELRARTRLSLEAVRTWFTAQLLKPDTAESLDRDFVQRFTAAGFRISD